MGARRVAANIVWSLGMLTLGCADTASGVSGTGMDAAARTDAAQEDRPAPPPPPSFRLRSPISNHAIGTSRPVLRWFSPNTDAEHVVTICADRRCETVQDRQTARGLTVQPTRDLPMGLHYWFVSTSLNGVTVTTPAWIFRTTWSTDAEPRTDDRGSAADFNGDGYSDVVILRQGMPYPEVIHGGSGPLTPIQISPGRSLDERIVELCGAADLNGDGYDDLAAWASSGQGYVSVALLGSHEGLSGLRRMPSPPDLPVPQRHCSDSLDLRRGDLDQDGYEDLVVGDKEYGTDGGGQVRVIWGGFSQAPWQLLSNSGDSGAVIFDINQDGSPDLLSMGVYYPTRGYRTSLGPLDRGRPWTYSERRNVTYLTLCDLDHDRVPDLIGLNTDPPLNRSGITGWLRGPGGSETPLPRIPALVWMWGCLSTNGADRLFLNLPPNELREIVLHRSSEDGSPSLVEVPLAIPLQSSQDVYERGPTASYLTDMGTQNLVLLRTASAGGQFVDVMSTAPRGAIMVRQSIQVAGPSFVWRSLL